MKPETTFVYNENCVMAGRPVIARLCPDGDDYTEVEISEKEACWYEHNFGDWGRKVANTIREMML